MEVILLTMILLIISDMSSLHSTILLLETALEGAMDILLFELFILDVMFGEIFSSKE